MANQLYKMEMSVSSFRNHTSALYNEEHIDKNIETELKYSALIGPFDQNPVNRPLTISPLMSVPKHNSMEHRTVIDLSFPAGVSVTCNYGIPADPYLEGCFKLRYPSNDSLISLINIHGEGCMLYKVDISRCFRWIPVDSMDYRLLGVFWKEKLHFDTKVPFGLRTGALAAQSTTNAISHIYRQMGKSCSFGFLRMSFVNCRQFMYLVISLLVLRAG